MINPFISVDQQLEYKGFKKFYDGDIGFIFIKPIGDGYSVKAQAELRSDGKLRIRIFDPQSNVPVYIEDDILELFAAKMKDWRKTYGRSAKTRKNSNKKRS